MIFTLFNPLAALLLGPLAALHAADAVPVKEPNILFILTDDQGYGDVGRHGNPILKTPNLDALHDQSVRFTDFCVSSSCSPTRASLMSGMFNLRAGVTHTIAPRCRMNPGLTILPQYLKAAGYTSACIGKWHLSADAAKFFGMVANIDENLGRLMRWLEEKDLARNTVVIFMNDNGGTYGVDTWNAGMRGCKCTAWPGGARAISFWRWPGEWKPRDVGALTAHVDVLPTLAALAGAKLADASLDGRSLLPLLEGREDPWFGERMLFQHNARWPSGMAARHKDCMAGVRWKEYLLVRSRPCDDPACARSGVSQCGALLNVERGSDVATYTKNAQFIWGLTPGDGWALYDVRKDPACEENLAPANQGIADKLRQAYDRWWEAIYPEMIAAGGDAPLAQAAVERVRGKKK